MYSAPFLVHVEQLAVHVGAPIVVTQWPPPLDWRRARSSSCPSQEDRLASASLRHRPCPPRHPVGDLSVHVYPRCLREPRVALPPSHLVGRVFGEAVGAGAIARRHCGRAQWQQQGTGPQGGREAARGCHRQGWDLGGGEATLTGQQQRCWVCGLRARVWRGVGRHRPKESSHCPQEPFGALWHPVSLGRRSGRSLPTSQGHIHPSQSKPRAAGLTPTCCCGQ